MYFFAFYLPPSESLTMICGCRVFKCSEKQWSQLLAPYTSLYERRQEIHHCKWHTHTHTHSPGSQPASPPSFSSNHTNCAFQTFHFKTTKTIAFKLKKDHCGEIAEDNICVSFSPSAYDQEVNLCLTYNSCPSFKWQQVKSASCFKPQRKQDIKRNKGTVRLSFSPHCNISLRASRR